MLGLIFLLIFVVFPIAELTVLIKLGGSIGWLPTIALIPLQRRGSF
jgi:UPF0716 protein FxsA